MTMTYQAPHITGLVLTMNAYQREAMAMTLVPFAYGGASQGFPFWGFVPALLAAWWPQDKNSDEGNDWRHLRPRHMARLPGCC